MVSRMTALLDTAPPTAFEMSDFPEPEGAIENTEWAAEYFDAEN